MKFALVSQRESVDAYKMPVDCLESAYVGFLESLGFVVVPVSNFCTSTSALFQLPGELLLVLTGGGSLQEEFYEKPYGYPMQPNRDRVERELLCNALEKKIPILGICRGMQFINGFFGGKITRLADREKARPNGTDHQVQTSKGLQYVNNFHNDGILREGLAAGALPIAIDEEHDIVEAFLMEKERILAIQWHPERKFEREESMQYTRNLIEEFWSKNIRKE